MVLPKKDRATFKPVFKVHRKVNKSGFKFLCVAPLWAHTAAGVAGRSAFVVVEHVAAGTFLWAL